MQWQGVQEFVSVVDEGSFTRAAQSLQLSTAQVSRQVSRLEARLKVTLLYRTTRQVSLTEAGQLFYQHAKGLLEGLNQAEQAVQQIDHEPHGQLKITAPGYYGEQRLSPLLNDFLLRYRELSIECVFTNERLDLLAEGIDLAVRLGPMESQAGLFSRRLGTRKLRVCASPEYLTRHGEPQVLADLARHNCLLGTLGFWRFMRQRQPITLKVSGSLRCSSGIALRDAALKGLGIVQLPDYYVEADLKAGRLMALLSDYQSAEEGIWAVYPQPHQRSPALQQLLQFLSSQPL